VSNPAEPWSDRGKRAHEAGGAQQFAPRPAARRQEAVEPLLFDLVHVQEAVLGAASEETVLDVLADDPGALLVAAAKKIAAIVMLRCGLVVAVMIVLVRHQPPFGPAVPDWILLVHPDRGAEHVADPLVDHQIGNRVEP